MAHYRFYFHPVRYTSLGLSVIEAMMVGLPIIGLATTELVTVIRCGQNGYLDTNVDALVGVMKDLLKDRSPAASMGREARKTAEERFHIDRFVADWCRVFARVTT
jgi:glycosyltransferase involved in cell wall biosynthesis